MDAERLNPLEGDIEYDVEALQQEVTRARAVQDFERGAYGHSISLPAAAQLDRARARAPQQPALRGRPGPLSHHGADPGGLRCAQDVVPPAAADRAHSAYALHDDKDKGAHMVRLQIPIVTNQRSFLFLPTDALDLEVFQPYVRAAKADAELPFDLETLRRLCGSELRLFRLRPGRIYYFDTDRIHTLLNAGDQDRITLSIDLISNDWLRAWMAEHFTRELEPCAAQITEPIRWNWNALRHGVIRNEPRTD